MWTLDAHGMSAKAAGKAMASQACSALLQNSVVAFSHNPAIIVRDDTPCTTIGDGQGTAGSLQALAIPHPSCGHTSCGHRGEAGPSAAELGASEVG